jgi:hypothetical protein
MEKKLPQGKIKPVMDQAKMAKAMIDLGEALGKVRGEYDSREDAIAAVVEQVAWGEMGVNEDECGQIFFSVKGDIVNERTTDEDSTTEDIVEPTDRGG